MADAKVSKTFDLNGRVGSTPTFGTNYLVRLGYFNNPDGDWGSSTPLILFAENIGITLTLTRWMHVPCNYEYSNISQIF